MESAWATEGECAKMLHVNIVSSLYKEKSENPHNLPFPVFNKDKPQADTMSCILAVFHHFALLLNNYLSLQGRSVFFIIMKTHSCLHLLKLGWSNMFLNSLSSCPLISHWKKITWPWRDVEQPTPAICLQICLLRWGRARLWGWNDLGLSPDAQGADPPVWHHIDCPSSKGCW